MTLFALLILMPAFALVRAFAIQLGWTWFLVRAFPHLPHSISLVTALGLSLVAGLLFTSFFGADADSEATEGWTNGKRIGVAVTRAVFLYGTYFIFALLIHALA